MKEKLWELEAKIEFCYCKLIELEIKEQETTQDYHDYCTLLKELIKEETHVLTTLTIEQMRNFQKELKQKQEKLSPFAIGSTKKIYPSRILNLLNTILGEDIGIYIEDLRYDINQIIFSFLDILIKDLNYQNIKKELIIYKYELIFMNASSEHSFLLGFENEPMHFITKGYDRENNISYKYIDRSILVLESLEDIKNILSVSDYFQENSGEYAYLIINIIEILSRLSLCKDEELSFVYTDFLELKEMVSLSYQIKEEIENMIQILDILKNKIIKGR